MEDPKSKLSIGAPCEIPCAWTRDGTISGRVVSFDQHVACVAVKQEFLPNQMFDELFWVAVGDVKLAST